MNILGFYQDHIKQKLSPSQVVTLQILLYLISVHKTVQISKLTNYFQLPIKSESKRKLMRKIFNPKGIKFTYILVPFSQNNDKKYLQLYLRVSVDFRPHSVAKY